MSGKRITGLWPASLLREFAALVDAGVPVMDALKSLSRRHRGLSNIMPDLLAGLQRGFALGDGLRIAGALSRQNGFLVNVAEVSGKLPTALNDIADRAELRDARVSRLGSRLLLTRLVAFIIIAIAVVKDLAVGAPAFAAISGALLKFIFVMLLTGLLIRAVHMDTAVWLAWAWKLKLIAKRKRWQMLFEHYYYTVLRWQISAGIPPAQAVTAASEALDNDAFRALSGQAAMDLQQGRSFHDAMFVNELIFSVELDQVIRAGENAGRLDQSLTQYQEMQQLHIDLETDHLLAWLPRIAYFFVVLIALDAISFDPPELP